jgi:hypothetical protein
VCTRVSPQAYYSTRVPGALDAGAMAISSANQFHMLPWGSFARNISWLGIAQSIGSIPPIVLRTLDFDTGGQEIEKMKVYNDAGSFAYYDMPAVSDCPFSLPFYQCQ